MDDTCTFQGCVLPSRYKKAKLCHGHYNQRWRGEELRPLRNARSGRSPRGDGDACTFAGCDRSRGAYRDLCKGHYQQRHHGQDLRRLRKIRMTPLTGENTCDFPGCERDRGAYKKYCGPHMKQKRSGKPLRLLYNRGGNWTLDGLLKQTTLEGECRIWSRSKAKYGNVWHGSLPWKAHRLSYHLATGEDVHNIPLHHKCARTLCINPDHLEPASTAENTLEMNGRRAYEAPIAFLQAKVEELQARPCDCGKV